MNFDAFGFAAFLDGKAAVHHQVPASFTFPEEECAALNGDVPKQQKFLLKWLRSLEIDLDTISLEVLKKHQASLEKHLLKLISHPNFSLPIIQLVARCLCAIFSKGESRSLFDGLTLLQGLAGQGDKKGVHLELAVRRAALNVLCTLTSSVGAKVLSLFAETVSITLKHIKGNDQTLKLEAASGLAVALNGIGRLASDQTMKEIQKTLKGILPERGMSIPLKTALAECTFSMARAINNAMPLQELESLVSLSFRSLEGSNYSLRRAVALGVSELMVLAFLRSVEVKSAAPPPKKGEKVIPPISEADLFNILEKDFVSAFQGGNSMGSSAGREIRVGIAETWVAVARRLGNQWFEKNFKLFVFHILKLASNPKATYSRPDALSTRELCSAILRKASQSLLGEAGQLSALSSLSEVIVQWPKPNGDFPNTKFALVVALNEMSALLDDLGSVASSAQEEVMAALMAAVDHHAYSVQMATSWCFRSLGLAVPSVLPKTLTKFLDSLQKTNNLLAADKTGEIMKKFRASGYALAALLSCAPETPLHVAPDVTTKVYNFSCGILKNMNRDHRIAAAQTRVAWTLIGSLLGQGPNLVKLHLPQLLNMWKLASKTGDTADKPVATTSSMRDPEEQLSLIIRESALGALYNFMINCGELVTADVTKKIITILNANLLYIGSLPPTPISIGMPSEIVGVPVPVLDDLIRKRVFLCFALIPAAKYEMMWEKLGKITIEAFTPTSDKAECPMTSMVPTVINKDDAAISGLVLDVDEVEMEEQLQHSSVGALGMDYTAVYIHVPVHSTSHKSGLALPSHNFRPRPHHPSVTAVNAAIQLFSSIFPLQPPIAQEHNLDAFNKALRAPKLQPSKRAHIQTNIFCAFLIALKKLMEKRSTIESKVLTAAQELLQGSLTHPDMELRCIACECLGRLAKVVGGQFVTDLFENLWEQLGPATKTPALRSGYAFALGCIHRHIGGLASGTHLKSSVALLQTLCLDPAPAVHTWALHSLSLVADSAGLMFSSYVEGTANLLSAIFVSQAHEPTFIGGATTTELYQALGRTIYSLINTLGPELQLAGNVRDVCFSLYEQLRLSDEPFVVVEALRCVQQFILFSSKQISIPELVPSLKSMMHSPQLLLRKAATICLWQLVQREAAAVSAAGHDIEEQLFLELDRETDRQLPEDVRDVIVGLLKALAPSNPSRWLALCRSIISQTTAESAAAASGRADDVDAEGDDDEERGEPKAPAPARNAPQARTPEADAGAGTILASPRWRTKVFALKCLRLVLQVLGDHAEQFDLILARDRKASGDNTEFLVYRVAELIRTAFSAATSPVDELRLGGLKALQDIVERFAAAKDPDYEGHQLLEQYQAQVGAALAPAFSDDSSPEIIALACNVCAIYLGSGISRELMDMYRVLKLVTTALEKVKDDIQKGRKKEASKDMSPHASIMVHLAILTAWAEIQVASRSKTYLLEVVKPYLPILSTLWLTALREYATVRLDPDLISIVAGESSLALDPEYAASMRDVVLPFYKKSWMVIMKAFTSLVADHDDLVLAALRDKSPPDENPPRILFTVVGICVQAIYDISGNNPVVSEACVNAIGSLIHPKIVGSEFLEKDLFVEIMNVFNRIVQMEESSVQLLVLKVLKQVIEETGSSYLFVEEPAQSSEPNGTEVAAAGQHKHIDQSSKVYNLLKVLLNVFNYHVPALSSSPAASVSARRRLTPTTAALLLSGLETLASLISIASFEHKAELLPLYLIIFAALVENDKFKHEVAPAAVRHLKTFLVDLGDNDAPDATISKSIRTTVRTLLDSMDTLESKLPTSFPVSGEQALVLKNLLLATTIIMTSCPNLSNEAILIKRFSIFLGKMISSKHTDIAVTCFQCLRTIQITGAGTLKPLYGETSRSVLPLIAQAVLHPERDDHFILEAVKTFASWYGSYHGSERYLALSFTIPTLIRLLPVDSTKQNTDSQKWILATLLQAAGADPKAFKKIVAGLPASAKTTLESSLRASGGK